MFDIIMEESAELVLIPCPGRGHLPAALEFAKLVVGRDDRLSITVLIMKLPIDPTLALYADSLVASFTSSQRIKFLHIDNECVSADQETTKPIVYMNHFVESHKLNVKSSVNKMVLDSGTRLAGFIVDMMLTPMAAVADEFGVPTYVYWTSSAGFLSLKLHFTPVEDHTDQDSTIDVLGFAKPVPIHAIPTLSDDASAAVASDIMERTRKAKGVVINTSAEIEPHAIASLISSSSQSPPVYPVGPVLNLTPYDGADAFSSSQAVNTIEWLNDQPPSSVIFLCFGSLGSFGRDQVKEIAWALERTGFRFLWTLRYSPPKDSVAFVSGVCEDPGAILPEGFLDRAAKIGRVISWAPQAAVLAHPAVGGFVSHCGWNSLLESLWFGVPVAAWPLFSEQHLNAFEMVTELGLGVEIKMDYKAGYDTGIDCDAAAVVSAGEIEAGIRRVMEGESGVRKRVKEMSEKCRRSVIKGGSSRSSLDVFVSHVFENLRLN